MADINNNAILEVVIRSHLNAQENLTVLHYRLSDLSAPADEFAKLEAADDRFALADGIYDAYANACSEDLEFREVQLQWIHPIRYAYRRFASMPLIGQLLQPALPQNVAVTLTKRSEQAGRHGIGSVHMPGVSTFCVTAGEVNNDGQPIYAALGTALKTPYTMATGGTLTPVIYNRVNPGISRDVATVVVQEAVRVQRRRTRGLGI